jgi:hypothetical protein
VIGERGVAGQHRAVECSFPNAPREISMWKWKSARLLVNA